MTPSSRKNLLPSASNCGSDQCTKLQDPEVGATSTGKHGLGSPSSHRRAEALKTMERSNCTPDSSGRKRPRSDLCKANARVGAPRDEEDASENAEDVMPSQRRRRRLFVQESPESDDEDDEIVEVPLEDVTPASTRPSTGKKRVDQDGDNVQGQKIAKPISFGTVSSGENPAATSARRSVRLRKQNSTGPAHSGPSSQAVSVDSDLSSRTGNGHRRHSNLDDFFGTTLSIFEAESRVVNLIGGAVSKDQVQHIFPGAAGESPLEKDDAIQEPKNKNKRGRPLPEESPPELSIENSILLPGEDMVGCDDSILLTQNLRSRPVDGSSASRGRDSRDVQVSFSMLDLPKTMTALPEILPKHLYSVPFFSSVVSVADGNKEDDSCFRNAVNYEDWLYSAESLDFDSLSREYLVQNRQSLSMPDITSCLKHLRDSNILSFLPNFVEVRPEKARILLGICLRLLSLDLGDVLMSGFLKSLIRAREAELESNSDSLLALVSNAHRSSKSYHKYMQAVWVCFLDACRGGDTEEGASSFWVLWNKNWFGRASESGNAKTVCAIVNKNNDKLLNSSMVLGSLFAFQLEKPLEETPVVLTPNWASIQLALKNASEMPCSRVEEPRQSMFHVLRRVCTEFADRLWKVREDFVLNVLECIKSVCVKFDSACSCRSIPAFLGQFKNISDLRSRRLSLPKFLLTECDCAMYLAWVLIAQAPKSSSKLSTKIIRHSTNFLKASGCSKDPAKALTHHIGLMLTISESIVQGNPSKEHLLLSMLFSKAPKLSRAASDPFSFGPSSIACWSSVLEAVKLRVRILLGSGSSIHGYSDFICTNVASCLQFIEKPESQFAADPKKREAWRVQQHIFVELVGNLLSALNDVLALLTQNLNQETYTNHVAIDELLTSLSKFVGRLGKFAAGIVAQIGTSHMGNASSGRKAMLKGIVSFIEQGLELCTAHAHGRSTRNEPSASTCQLPVPSSNATNRFNGMDAFVRNVKSSVLTAFVVLAREPPLKDESKADWELRLLACRALAKTLGICCIGPTPDYTRHSSMDLVQVIQQANMSVFDISGTFGAYMPLQAHASIQASRVPSYSQAPQHSQVHNASQTPNYSQAPPASQPVSSRAQWHVQESQLFLQAEFWGALLDHMWSRAFLSISERFEEVVFGMWVIIIVVSSSLEPDSSLGKSLTGLSYAIRSAASISPNIGKWFYATNFGKKCTETAIACRFSVMDLDGEGRVEALVDSFCAVLQSWTSAKVLHLVNFIRRYVTSNSSPARVFSAPTSRPFFRPSKDIEQAEQLLLHTQVLSVLFVMHASLSLPSSQYRGGRVGNDGSVSAKFLNDISDSLSRALNKFRSGPSAKYATAHSQIQVLVVKGLATLGYDTKDIETRIGFSRFVRLFSGENMCGLFTWNDDRFFPAYLKREPFMLMPSATDPVNVNRRQALEKNSREWRVFAFHTLVTDPIERKMMNSIEVRGALRHVLDIVQSASFENIRNTGMWPNVCKVAMLVGERRSRIDSTSVHGVAVSSLLSKICDAVCGRVPASEQSFFRKQLLGRDS